MTVEVWELLAMLHQCADVHLALRMLDQGRLTDAAKYLQQLCFSITKYRLERLRYVSEVLRAPKLFGNSVNISEAAVGNPIAGHIIVVDDDSTLRQTLAEYLEKHNLPVIAASNRRELNELIQTDTALILLDLQLGQDDGLDVLRDIRFNSKVPVIIITGHRLDETDRVVALELGADDYIMKPFSLREMLARIRAVLRGQAMGRAARARDPERGGYRFDGWRLERRGRRLIQPNGAPVAVSKGEFALLLAFLEAPQRPLSREQLLQATRVHEDIFDRSIDVQVLRLRQKLEIDPSAPLIIQTVRGVGYIFALSVEPF
jgi:DNA-binding response OmpR family regulator